MSEDRPELILIPAYVDDRGYLWQLFEGDNIKRTYAVGNFDKSVVRGFHLHREESKWFFIVKGAAKFVTVNEKDETINTFVLSDKRPAILHIPPGYYNGWKSLEEGTILIGMSDKTLEESKKDDFREEPFKFGDVWGVKSR